jgi:hypothetical protein
VFNSGIFGIALSEEGYSVECFPDDACEPNADGDFVTIQADGGVEAQIWAGEATLVWDDDGKYTVTSGGWGTEIDPASVGNTDVEWVDGVRLFAWPVCERADSAELCVGYNR